MHEYLLVFHESRGCENICHNFWGPGLVSMGWCQWWWGWTVQQMPNELYHSWINHDHLQDRCKNAVVCLQQQYHNLQCSWANVLGLSHTHSHSVVARIYTNYQMCLGQSRSTNVGLGPCNADPHLQPLSCCMHILADPTGGGKCLGKTLGYQMYASVHWAM